MDLNTIWFILVTVLFVGFFFLEGFDFGVGTLLPFLGKNDTERRVIINTIGPFWDGNEVWLLTAGGAIFAAFPHWYATMFSGFYLALFIILLALIVRGVGFEFRSKHDSPQWRNLWDWMIFIGSILPAILFGVAFGNIIRGVAIDATMTYTGTFFDLLNPFSLVTGVVFGIVLVVHGALFLSLKTTGVIKERAQAFASKVGFVSTVALVLFFAYAFAETTMFEKIAAYGVAGVAVFSSVLAALFTKGNADGKAFIAGALSIVCLTITIFIALFPNVMISTTDAAFSLTIYNASSSAYTLKVMTIVAVIFVPVVVVYQGWTYWIFRKRVTADELHY